MPAVFAPLRNVALDGQSCGAIHRRAGCAHITRADFDLTAAGDLPLAPLKGGKLHVRQLRLNGAL